MWRCWTRSPHEGRPSVTASTSPSADGLVAYGPGGELSACIQGKIMRLVTNADNGVRRLCERWDTPVVWHRARALARRVHNGEEPAAMCWERFLAPQEGT